MKKGMIAILATTIGMAAGAASVGTVKGKTIKKKEEKIDKFKDYYNLLNQWLILKQEGKSLAKYFEGNNYKTIAVYGMGELGNRLYDELKETNIEVKYAIDKEAQSTYAQVDVVNLLEDDLQKVDAIVVTAIFAFEEIKEEINQVVNYPVISLEDIVYEY